MENYSLASRIILKESTFRSMYFLNPWQKTKEKNLLESFFLELEVMELVV